MRWAIFIGLLGAIFLGASGCALLRPEAVESLPSRVWKPGELLQALAQRERQSRSLRALARVSYSGKEGRTAFEEAIVVQRPDRLRLETLSSVGAVLVVTVDGKEIVGFHLREGLFYRGRISKQNIFRTTRIPLELAELTSLLMGLPPTGAQGPWEERDNAIHRELGDGGREVAEFHPGLAVPTRWERMGADGQVTLRAIFSDFFSTPAGSFPLKIFLEAPPQQRRLEIRYQEPELNAGLPLTLFVQEKPASAKEVPLESLGG